MTNLEVMQAFLQQRDGRSGSMTSVNGRLFSYGTVIAQYGYGEIVINTTKYSSTTSKQLTQFKNLLAPLIRRNGQKIVEVNGFYIGTTTIVNNGLTW